MMLRINNGIKFLDDYFKDDYWMYLIDENQLWMEDFRACVLGQLFGSYSGGLAQLFGSYSDGLAQLKRDPLSSLYDHARSCKYGFSGDEYTDFTLLTRRWTRVLQMKKKKAVLASRQNMQQE